MVDKKFDLLKFSHLTYGWRTKSNFLNLRNAPTKVYQTAGDDEHSLKSLCPEFLFLLHYC